MYCTITVLYCDVLYRTVLYCTVLYCTVLYLGSVKVRVTLRSAMPPLLMATQLYWPRSLEVTAVTVRLKFLSMPPSGREFVKTCHSSCFVWPLLWLIHVLSPAVITQKIKPFLH